MNISAEYADQARLIKALLKPDVYGGDVASVTLIETHISWLLLTGHFAFKIKKPVNFGFLDFSTLEKRRFYCEEELRLNQRLSENLYLEVTKITGDLDHPEINGAGPVLDYAVKMRQFESGCLLTELVEQNRLTVEHIDQVANMLSQFHAEIEVAKPDSNYGEPDNIKHWADENFLHIRELYSDDQLRAILQALETWTQREWEQKLSLFKTRKLNGFVRECHGDMHLANLTLLDGRVVAFDCIEFNPNLRWLDVMSELAFLVMDLNVRKLDQLSNRLLNLYLQATGDYQGLTVMHYYLVYRAMVRAKVALLRFSQNSVPVSHDKSMVEFHSYLQLAHRYVQKTKPMLIITHGFSGSGKSTFANVLAEKIGAIQVRSDIERKRLFGFKPLESTNTNTDISIYSKNASYKTYRHLISTAASILDSGYPVIVDAAFLHLKRRQPFQELAKTRNIPFLILDFQATETELVARIERRQKQGQDPSEATVEVLMQQVQNAEALSEVENELAIHIDTQKVFEEVAADMLSQLKAYTNSRQ